MQIVEVYYGVLEAERDMKKHINLGWRVHICTMSCYAGNEKILVVYEK